MSIEWAGFLVGSAAIAAAFWGLHWLDSSRVINAIHARHRAGHRG